MNGTTSPPPGRTIDIELGGQEVITVELDSLDPNPDDLLELLRDGQCKVWIWTRLAAEYRRRGHLDAAEKIARIAIESKVSMKFFSQKHLILHAALQVNETSGSVAPVYAFLANLQIARASKAPKLILSNAGK